MKTSRALAGLSLLLPVSVAFGAEPGRTVLVEAEGFDRLGGWVIDQQFCDQTDSPTLTAHERLT